MWIDTDDGVVNLGNAERIAVVNGNSVHIFRSGGGLLGAIQFPTPEEAEAAYTNLKIALGVKPAPVTGSDLARITGRLRPR